MPLSITATVSTIPVISLRDFNSKNIQNQIKRKEFEPLSHELLREAVYLKTQFKRSSLVIAVAAIETGIKYLLKKLIPDASWIIQELQTPPISRIMTNFLSSWSSLIDPAIKIKFPKHIQDIIKQMVQQRNQIVHGRQTKIHWRELNFNLEELSSFFYLIDFYCGYECAKSFVKKEWLTELNI